MLKAFPIYKIITVHENAEKYDILCVCLGFMAYQSL